MIGATPHVLSTAFSPGHITGILEKPVSIQANDNLINLGSKGVGFCIARGITTVVKLFKTKAFGYSVTINGSPTNGEVSKWILEYYVKLFQQGTVRCQPCSGKQKYYIQVEHLVDIPVGFGLGSSGAAALSLSYALNEALGTGLTRIESAQIAHIAEISCRTGLGTVLAEFAGGFEIRTSIGAPGIGLIEKLQPMTNSKAVILCMSPISTKSVLANNNSNVNLVNGLGARMVNDIRKSKNVNEFLKMSYDFSGALTLTNGICKGPIELIRSLGFYCGVALFGKTIFTIVPSNEVNNLAESLKRFRGKLIVANIDTEGARIIRPN
jgi:pantoate kinase